MKLQEQIMQLQPEPDRDGIHLHPTYKEGFGHARQAAAKLAAQHIPATEHWADWPEDYVITKAKNVMLGAMTYPYTPAASDDDAEDLLISEAIALRAKVKELQDTVLAQSNVIEAGLLKLLEGKSNALIVNSDGAYVSISPEAKMNIFMPSWVKGVTIRCA